MKGRRIALIGVVAFLAGALALVGAGTAFAVGPFGGLACGYGPGGNMAVGWRGMMGGHSPGGMMGGWAARGAQGQGQTITFDQAIRNVQAYVDQSGNQELAVDEVMEFESNFYAIVKEKSGGKGAFELLVNRYTGGVFPEMGPNMMWNTKYGMHAGGPSGGYGGMMGQGMMSGYGGGMMGGQNGPTQASGPMSVTPEQARVAAQRWLDQNQPGSTTEGPDEFSGYFTIHTLKDGKISGMLSVNGYTGQVWYHSWHGAFVQMRQVG